MNNKSDWFISERSEALASMLLRSRADIRVQDEKKSGDGADFVVDVSEGDSLWRHLFVVQVKGTLSHDYKKWFESATQLFKPNNKSPMTYPSCLFLINIRDRKAYYAWVAEPLVERDKSATLKFPPAGDFHDLDQSAVDGIINRVKDWYAALPNQLIPHAVEP